MIYKTVRLKNAGPFLADWEVELPEGPTVVVARYEESEVRSNRGGKSFFAVDCPLYALFGRFRGSKVDEFPHRLARGKEESWVELEVTSSDGRDWTVKRGRTASGDPIRELNGSQISEKDLLRTVEDEILGLSYEEYVSTNAFVQGEMHAFMQKTPAEKRKLVSPWFKTDRWVPRVELARKRLKAAQRDLRVLAEREAEEREDLDRRAGAEEVWTLAAAETAELREDLSAVLERGGTLKADLAALEESRKNRTALEAELERAREEAAEEREAAEGAVRSSGMALDRSKEALKEARVREDRRRVLEGEVEQLEALRADLEGTRGDLRTAEREVKELSAQREVLLKQFRELKDSRTGVCPVLRESCDRVEPDPAVLDGLKREGLTARRAIERGKNSVSELKWKLENVLAEVSEASKAEQDLSQLREEVSLAEAERNYEEASRRFQRDKTALSKLKSKGSASTRAVKRLCKELEKLSEVDDSGLLEKAAALREEKSLLEVEIKEAEAREVDALGTLKRCERAEVELEKISQEREETRRRVKLLAWTSYAFGAAGIPSRELENAFGAAEDSMNRVLSGIGTPLRLSFSPTRELNDWEPACLACGETFEKGERTHVCKECGTPRRKRRRDELRLEVEDGGQESSFDLDSGGGKVFLSIGARLGLSALPGSTRAVRCEHILIDEPDGALDEVNRAALHELIRSRMAELGIRQVILVTHADVRREFSSVVTVHRWEEEDRSAVWKE